MNLQLRRLLRGSISTSISTSNGDIYPDPRDDSDHNGDDEYDDGGDNGGEGDEELEQLIVDVNVDVDVDADENLGVDLYNEDTGCIDHHDSDDSDDYRENKKLKRPRRQKRRRRGQHLQLNEEEDYDYEHEHEHKYGYRYDKDDDNEYKYTQRRLMTLAIICAAGLISILCVSTFNRHSNRNNRRYWTTSSNVFPDELLQDEVSGSGLGSGLSSGLSSGSGSGGSSSGGVYSLSDFRNDIGIAVPYWKDLLATYNLPYDDFDDNEAYYDDGGGSFFNDEAYGVHANANVNSNLSSSSLLRKNVTSGNNDTDDMNINMNVDKNGNGINNGIIPHLGPCYLPHTIEEMNDIEWSALIEKNYNKSHNERNIIYPAPYVPYSSYQKQQQKLQQQQHSNERASHHSSSSSSSSSSTSILQQSSNLANYCRPGFIIIGAGKCGTSSLYHYLTGHDRVAPAKKKQIHYFKYYPKRPMSWYLSHFYGAQDFLSSGSLITGEASPGYLPYPDVAHRIRSYMANKANNGYNGYNNRDGQAKANAIVPMPKIITIVRNPLERSYSSYNYNYVEPALLKIKKDVDKARRKFNHRGKSGSNSNSNSNSTNNLNRSINNKYHSSKVKAKGKGRSKNNSKNSEMVDNILTKNMTDGEIIDEYLFSFEQLIEAEMVVLKECLKKGGAGEQGAKALYGSKPWAMPLFKQREKLEEQQQQQLKGNRHTPPSGSDELPPLVTMDDSCYGDTVSATVPRIQWKELVESYPHKIINVKNLHLVQSIIGRSLYSLPLEWWYELYPSDDLYLVCNEDLKYRPSKTMSDVSDFLGLPAFDFDPVVTKGMYNVGGNDGYDRVTDWEKVKTTTTRTNHKKSGDGIPISDELRAKYLSFVKPYNERLFELAEKRCDW